MAINESSLEMVLVFLSFPWLHEKKAMNAQNALSKMIFFTVKGFDDKSLGKIDARIFINR
jgi:hypothetical protein